MAHTSVLGRARRGGLALAASLCLSLCAGPGYAADAGEGGGCVPIAKWVVPGDGAPINLHEVLKRLAGKQIILLGEHHDNPEHHRWQLQMLAALYGEHPHMVIGFEMFPRRVQPVLDKWVRGELTEKEFLKQSDWDTVWSYDPQMYMPIFYFARMNRIPMYALNMDRSLLGRIRDKGMNAVPEKQRYGLTEPAPPSDGYLDMLDEIYHQHGVAAEKGITPEQFYKKDRHFHLFVRGQLLWDRAMAQGLAKLAGGHNPPLVVGLMGSGHLIYHFGIPHQLASLGIKDSVVLVPWDKRFDCKVLTPKFADMVFGVRVPEVAEEKDNRPLLGVYLAAGNKGPKIDKVIDHSVAEATGIKAGDVLVEMAGRPVTTVEDAIKRVRATLPGTWLPLVVMRDDKRIDLVAKFPPAK